LQVRAFDFVKALAGLFRICRGRPLTPAIPEGSTSVNANPIRSPAG
jgi:hypothetical protein